MNRFLRTALIGVVLGLAVCGAGLAQTSEEPLAIPAPPEASPVAWPRQFSHGDSTFTIYPPQLDRWQGDRLEGRAAVAVQSASSDKPSFGVVTLTARTEADSAGMVLVRELTASRASFPAATDRAAAYLDAIRQSLKGVIWSIPAHRLRADVAIDRAAQQAQGEPLRNDPPRIIYTQSPTILVPVDGQPVHPGTVYVAPGDFHLTLQRRNGGVVTVLDQTPARNSHRPAADALFCSAADSYGPRTLALVLTGMGQDGVRGSEDITRAGGRVLVQDEATSVVWGMPGFVSRAGLADAALPLGGLRGEILRRVAVGRDRALEEAVS